MKARSRLETRLPRTQTMGANADLGQGASALGLTLDQLGSSEAPARLRDYYQLTKPTIAMLVVITAIPGLVMAAPTLPSLATAFAALLGTALAAASAGVFNHLVDSDIDNSMLRTRGRPLPSGKVSQATATWFGAILGITSFTLLWFGATPLAAWIALAANAFYVVVYTMYLKRRTAQNIVIGGAAGAVGPLIGWAAVTGHLGWPAWVLFLVIFLWTPPHFWALALKYKDDYARAGIPMLPVVAGDEVTRRQMLLYTLSLLPTVYALYAFGAGHLVYLVAAGGFTLYFAYLALRLYRAHNNTKAMPLFHYSCLYLFGVFGALTIDRIMSLL